MRRMRLHNCHSCHTTFKPQHEYLHVNQPAPSRPPTHPPQPQHTNTHSHHKHIQSHTPVYLHTYPHPHTHSHKNINLINICDDREKCTCMQFNNKPNGKWLHLCVHLCKKKRTIVLINIKSDNIFIWYIIISVNIWPQVWYTQNMTWYLPISVPSQTCAICYGL